MNSEIVLTVFTPTYNRRDELDRLHASLLAQTNQGFEWLVVDDGSVDGTDELLDRWLSEGLLNFRYVRQRNSGKHAAHNLGAKMARGRLFMCVDSDDWLEPNAVETILRDAGALDTEEGLLYPRLFSTKTALDTWLPSDASLIELSDMRMRYGLVAETAIVFPVDALRRHPFPVFDGERFLPEEASYFDFVAPECFLVRDDPIYRCEYLDEGLTKNLYRNWFNNPLGVICALNKRYEAAERYSGFRSLRERVSAVAGMESLNMAVGRKTFEGVACSSVLFLLVFPLAVYLKGRRYKGMLAHA